MHYRGLTWDHPRGYRALQAAAARLTERENGLTLDWYTHSLEGFEAHPIADLCARYDLVVLDHPHVGEAVDAGCLVPLETLFNAAEIADWGAVSIGPSLASYRYAEGHWALPLDAATQVMAARADLLDDALPQTWAEVLALSERRPVALSLAGPHAALTFQSIVAAIDGARVRDPDRFVQDDSGATALNIMAPLAARTPEAARNLNPIALLERMRRDNVVALCPLVYGYVNYAAPVDGGRAILFGDAPASHAGGRRGSTLGGTGIGISTRAEITPPLLDHLRWLMSDIAQRDFIPAHDGQPSQRSAWSDEALNARWGNFYRNTAATLEDAYVRPRFSHAIALQTEVSALLRDGLAFGTPHATLLGAMQDAYRRHRPLAAEL